MFNKNFKQQIIHQLVSKLEQELKAAEAASESMGSFRHEQDMKQEGKYDTRAIEAGYLAGAQLKRVEEIKQEIEMINELNIREYNQEDEVAAGAIVELELNDKSQQYFLTTTSGGSILMIQGKPIMVISVFSPIGDAVLGLKVGDGFELETPKETREYTILSIS